MRIVYVLTLLSLFHLFGLSYAHAQGCSGPNLATNPGFESGTTTGWYNSGGTMSVETNPVHSGSYSCLISNRNATYEGPLQNIMPIVLPGKTYCISAWVRWNPGSVTGPLVATLKKTDSSGTNYIRLSSVEATDAQWVLLNGLYEHDVSGTLRELFLYFEEPYIPGTSPRNGFYIDDLTIQEFPTTSDWKTIANQNIDLHRKRSLQIIVKDQQSVNLKDATVTIKQLKHSFAFGSAITASQLGNTTYTDFFNKHFEWAVFENESKWYYNEATQGTISFADADALMTFCDNNDILVRGHCLFWEVDQFVQDWLKNLSTDALRAAMLKRILDAAGHFKGNFLHWDVNNEMLHGDFYRSRLGDDIAVTMFKETKKIDPGVHCFVNDYSVLAGGETNNYVAQIQRLTASGAPVDGIGCQGHFDAGIGVNYDVLKYRLDILASLSLPIWITEFDATDPDENARAEKLETLYRTAFSHPSVEGILMWGFWANAHWRGADAAIVNANWTLNKAGERYESLLKEWTTEESQTTATDGSVNFRGFHGKYVITISLPGFATIVDTILLEKNQSPLIKTFTLSRLTSVSDISDRTFSMSVYPNPAHRNPVIRFQSELPIYVHVIDIFGRSMYSTSDIGAVMYMPSGIFSCGVYFVKAVFRTKVEQLPLLLQ